MTPTSGARAGSGPAADRWAEVRSRLRAAGLRWTSQRGAILEVLEGVDGHVTGADIVERSRRIDPETTPSTVYRTLDVLEELGVVAHSHGREGRQEFHVNPVAAHGHLVCTGCARSWELGRDEVDPLLERLRAERGFEVAVDHLSLEGRCSTCRAGSA